MNDIYLKRNGWGRTGGTGESGHRARAREGTAQAPRPPLSLASTVQLDCHATALRAPWRAGRLARVSLSAGRQGVAPPRASVHSHRTSSSRAHSRTSEHEQQASATSTTSTIDTTPPASVEGGLLTIRLIEARGIALPHGIQLSTDYNSTHSSAASSPSRSRVGGHQKRESVQRKEHA